MLSHQAFDHRTAVRLLSPGGALVKSGLPRWPVIEATTRVRLNGEPAFELVERAATEEHDGD